MATTKIKKVFFCQSCGHESPKWMGQCPGCKEWNTMVEETVYPEKKSESKRPGFSGGVSKPVTLKEIPEGTEERTSSGMEELDRVLGGGIVKGSLVLVGGDPGIGKSTLLLQLCRNLSRMNRKLLYVSGEESLQQIRLRANRLGEFGDSLKLLCETDLDLIEGAVERDMPEILIIDSIQTMMSPEVSSAPGSVSQVREATARLLLLAKGKGITVFIVGHVTKEGAVAGPRVLEHMVDTVLYFEGDRFAAYRVLRGVKNRFGSTDEIGVFEMMKDGLGEVKNPSQFMLQGRPENASGSAVVCSVQGTRPLLLEIQALVCQTSFGIPRRQATGCDTNRLNLLMAVLERRAGMKLGDCDAYVNLTGGLKVQEPAMDLGIVLAVMSGYQNKILDPHTAVFGEVGLSGEVRAVSMSANRVSEARKLGFTDVILPAANVDACKEIEGIRLHGVKNLQEAAEYLSRL